MKSGLLPLKPDGRDYSLLHTFCDHPLYGATVADPSTLPDNFSIYDGQTIPDQNLPDTRFDPPVRPLPYGCTGETGAFACGIQDDELYRPDDLYDNTPPIGSAGGRDARAMLKTLQTRGPRRADGTFGPARGEYFNCYGAGKIDDFDAARIGLWINQFEKRGVIVGSWWYWGSATNGDDSLWLPSFKTAEATLHLWLITGWRTLNGEHELECIPWLGETSGNHGLRYMKRDIYNRSMRQPWTGAFTIAKTTGATPVPVGLRAQYDHVVYALVQFVRDLFGT